MAGTLSTKKAVIFDLDGTLSDSIASIKYSGDKALGEFGYGPFTEKQYKYFVGDGAANLVKRALTAGGDRELAHFEDAFERYTEIFKEYCMYQVKLSNKPHANTVDVIETLFGKDCFDKIQGQTEGIAIKPSPEGVFLILKEWEMTPEDILYLGDTATDMRTGKGAGAFTVGALWGFRERGELLEGGADALIRHPVLLWHFYFLAIWY